MEKQDPGKQIADLLRKAFTDWAGSLRVSMPCKVLSYDGNTQTASVLPLIRTGDADPAPIQAIQAIGQRLMINGNETYCPPILHTGDVVMVVFADREFKQALSARKPTLSVSSRSHSVMDGVIVGVFQ